MGTSIFQRLLLLSCVGMVSFWSFASIEKMEELSASGHSSMQLDEPATNTPLPPTATNTPLPPTATNTPLPPTATNTPLPPTATNTPLPPTATNTPLPPTATNTPLPPTPTHTATPAPSNQPPSISVIADRSINEDQSTGIITFTVADLETPANQLTVTAASSDTTLLPAAGLKLGGSGSSRNIKLIPTANKHGSATVTITVGDGSKNAQRSFTLKVRPINDPPLIDLNGSGSGVDFSMLYVSKDGPIHIVDSDARVSDVDRSDLSAATITITNLLDGADEVLTADTEGTGISASYNAGVLILNGSDKCRQLSTSHPLYHLSEQCVPTKHCGQANPVYCQRRHCR